MATSVERNAQKAMTNASNAISTLAIDVNAYVGDYRWNSKTQEGAAIEWDNLQDSIVQVKSAMTVLIHALALAHDAVNSRYSLSAASTYDDSDVLDVE